LYFHDFITNPWVIVRDQGSSRYIFNSASIDVRKVCKKLGLGEEESGEETRIGGRGDR
jgi:hypothetical protein